MRRLPAALTIFAALVTTACASTPPDPEDVEDGFAVDQGKEDNFLSLSAKEFDVEGTSTLTVPAGTSLADVKKLVSLKHIAIAWFLDNYLVDKESDDANNGYGGYSAMVKTGSYDDLAITKTSDTTYSFKFTQTIAGKNNLLAKAPFSTGKFSVEIGKPTNDEMSHLVTNEEWYRNAPWADWDPSKVDASKKETLALTIKTDTTSTDAWWDYNAMFADGKLDIDVYFGWDYNADYHLKHSKMFYNFLLGKGFKSPVKNWDDYNRKSGPLTKSLNANGKQISVEIRIIYPRPGSDTDPDTDAGGKVLEAEMRDSVKKRDVIVYSGHSGPFYGFSMANWNKTLEGDWDDSDMITADLATKYQIYLAEACDTYMVGNAILQNPNKNGKNADVITTTSFSNAETPATVEAFISRLIETDTASRHRPRTVKALLTDLDADATSVGFTTEYGIHGVDDDPKLHPYANEDAMCNTCKVNADCGGIGNACITIGHEGKRCAPACSDDAGCAEGYSCKKVASASNSTIYASMCVPTDNKCE